MVQHKSTTKTKRQSASRSPKKSAARPAASDEPVTIDRRHKQRRDEGDVAAPKLERRQKVNRRRQIDPTTCERDYTEHEVEFMNALDDYKRKSGRMFPTCSEVLEVIQSLGYVKLPAGSTAAMTDTPPTVPLAAIAPALSDVPLWGGQEATV